MAGVGGGAAALGLLHTLNQGNIAGPALGLGGLAAGLYGLSGGELGKLGPALQTLTGNAPKPAVPEPAVATRPTTSGLSMAEAIKHPQLQKYFNTNGSPRVSDIMKATDADVSSGLGLLSPEARAQLRGQVTGFKPSWGQSLGAKAIGIDIEGQRKRLLGLMG